MTRALQGGEGGQKLLGLRVLEPKWHNATLAHIEKIVNRRELAFLLNFDVHQTVIRDVCVLHTHDFFVCAWFTWESTSNLKITAYGSQAFPAQNATLSCLGTRCL